jgi:hypothetical protein
MSPLRGQRSFDDEVSDDASLIGVLFLEHGDVGLTRPQRAVPVPLAHCTGYPWHFGELGGLLEQTREEMGLYIVALRPTAIRRPHHLRVAHR